MSINMLGLSFVGTCLLIAFLPAFFGLRYDYKEGMELIKRVLRKVLTPLVAWLWCTSIASRKLTKDLCLRNEQAMVNRS